MNKKDRNSNIKEKKSVITEFKLGKEYFNKGIIAFARNEDQYLPEKSGMTVTVSTDNGDIKFIGNFTRSSAGDRRFINCYSKLAEYYKQNFKMGDMIKVRVMSSTEFIIGK
jgi:hypothetical protein